MTQKNPKVSVLTPIYNTNPTHLREMIESILNQTFADFEFLILNDSPDNTELDAVVKSYKDKRIKYFKNKKNMGITPSRNKLLEMAHGEYIAIFDHDDISVPTRLEKEVAYLDAHPHVGVVSGFIQNFGTVNDVRIGPEHDIDIQIALTDRCCVYHTAAMIRKSVLDENKIAYEEYYTPCEDYRLWSRLMGLTHFHNIQEVLVHYRVFDNQTSNRMALQMNRMHETIQLGLVNRFPSYYAAAVKSGIVGTRFRLRLFGIIPLLKIKRNRVYLFECIPIFRMWWR